MNYAVIWFINFALHFSHVMMSHPQSLLTHCLWRKEQQFPSQIAVCMSVILTLNLTDNQLILIHLLSSKRPGKANSKCQMEPR